MKQLVLTAFYCFLFIDVPAQEIKKYVLENTIKIHGIDTASQDYSDLEAIGRALGNASVVMLGEQDHGDAPTFLAKTRLIKYLHEKKGFNVLAFESDFYGLTKGWDEVSNHPDSVYQFLKGNIYPLWSRSNACDYLFKYYIPNSLKSNEPLQISGFDTQLFLDYSYNNLKKDLSKYLTESNLDEKLFTETTYHKFLDAVEGLVNSQRKANSFDSDMKQVLNDGLEKIKMEHVESKDSTYWSVIIRNLIAFNNNSNVTRDKIMSKNLEFLIDKKYKGEKIIVWAANTHIMKYTDQISGNERNLDKIIFENMGTEFTVDPIRASSAYILGFVSYKGSAGRIGTVPFPIETPNKNGLENWIPEDIAYGYLDFKNYNYRFNNPSAPFLMKGPMHFTIPKKIAKIPWNLVYDGIFFIRDMYPVEKVELHDSQK